MPEVLENKIEECINLLKRRQVIQNIDCPLPEGFQLRELEANDFERGYLSCLTELTTVGNIDKHLFEERVKYFASRPESYYAFVVSDCITEQVVACCTLMVEYKMIHECGLVGHIEDVCVVESKRGLNLGKSLVSFSAELAKRLGCYKVILDCKPAVAKFYAKSGLHENGVQMSMYF